MSSRSSTPTNTSDSPVDQSSRPTSPNSQSGSRSASPSRLTLDKLGPGLSEVCRTVDESGFALSKVDIDGFGVRDISILQGYPHVRYLSARRNLLTNISTLTKMPSLVSADLEENYVAKLPAFPNRYLQYINLSHNKLTSLGKFSCKMLSYLRVDSNAMSSLSGISSCKNLQRLDANGNQLKTTKHIHDLPKLQMLQLGDNEIGEVVALDTLPQLKVLNLTGNGLTDLTGFEGAGEMLTVCAVIAVPNEPIASVTGDSFAKHSGPRC